MDQDFRFELLNAEELKAGYPSDLSKFPSTLSNLSGKSQYLCMSDLGELVGVAKIYISDSINLDFIEIAPNHRGEHLSNKLLHQLFERAQDKGCDIGTEGFTVQGRTNLVREIEHCEKLYNTKFVPYSSC